MLDVIRVEAYGDKIPLKGIASVAVRDRQTLAVSAYDESVSACRPLNTQRCFVWSFGINSPNLIANLIFAGAVDFDREFGRTGDWGYRKGHPAFKLSSQSHHPRQRDTCPCAQVAYCLLKLLPSRPRNLHCPLSSVSHVQAHKGDIDSYAKACKKGG